MRTLFPHEATYERILCRAPDSEGDRFQGELALDSSWNLHGADPIKVICEPLSDARRLRGTENDRKYRETAATWVRLAIFHPERDSDQPKFRKEDYPALKKVIEDELRSYSDPTEGERKVYAKLMAMFAKGGR